MMSSSSSLSVGESGVRRQTDARQTDARQTDGQPANSASFYVTLMAGYYNENFHVDMPQTFHTTDRRIALTRPRLYAELDYCITQGTILNICI